VWCIQELAVSSSCTARCGELETPVINLLASAVYVSYFLGSYSLEGTLWFWNDIYLEKFKEPPGLEGSISSGSALANLLNSTRGFRATDPRDKVFALLGVSMELLLPWYDWEILETIGTPAILSRYELSSLTNSRISGMAKKKIFP
jgi:hypothetical protein